MRAGRIKEAIPQLLDGATEAIKRGAPQSAHRALSSALASLHGEPLRDATILLVEALQEQGRWRESLDALEALSDLVSEERSQEVFALAALANAYLGTPTQEWLAFVPRLRHIMQTCPHTPSRVRAAKAVAHATSPLRDRKLARSMLDVVDKIPLLQLDADASAQVGLTRALLLFQAGDMEESYKYASAVLEELRSRGHASTLVVQLQTGLGAIRGRQGHYEEATVHHERALRDSALLGNDTLTAQICANLALCYGRLGRYEDQLKCAECSPTPSNDHAVVFTDIHLACSLAIANAVGGRISKLREAIAQCEERLGSYAPHAITQSWFLWKADALALAGLREEAFQTATRAVHGYGLRLECSALTGAFARWLALTCLGSDTEPQAIKLLYQFEDQLNDYDALDQVEILCARAYCESALSPKNRARITSRVELLPLPSLAPLRATRLADVIDFCFSDRWHGEA